MDNVQNLVTEKEYLYQSESDKSRTKHSHYYNHWYFNDLKYLVVDELTNKECFYSSALSKPDSIFDYTYIEECSKLTELEHSYQEFKKQNEGVQMDKVQYFKWNGIIYKREIKGGQRLWYNLGGNKSPLNPQRAGVVEMLFQKYPNEVLVNYKENE